MTTHEIEKLKKTNRDMQEALLSALPYVEDVLDNPEQLKCFKRGVVQKHANQIRKAIQLGEVSQ